MSLRTKFAVGIILALILTYALALWILQPPRLHDAAVRKVAAIHFSAQKQGSVANPLPLKESTLINIAQELSATQDASARLARVAALRTVLMEQTTNQTVTVIRHLLASKTNIPTGLGFKLDKHGNLDAPPTFRVFLLDQLGQIDAAAAAEEARVILQSKDSADEWALALRNLARGDSSPSSRELLMDKTADLLGYKPWQQDASVGYLEAFDTAVYLGVTNLIPALADLLRDDKNRPVAHAAFLALDRLVIDHPADALAMLESQPELMQGREQARANYFARADVRDHNQRVLLERYLLDSRLTAPELGKFASLYPNENYMISNNLLTPPGPPDRGPVTARDAESLRVLDEWLADPRFSPN